MNTSLYDFERQLSDFDAFRSGLKDIPTDNPKWQKALATIATIRRRASKIPGASKREYLVGLLFHAFKVLLTHETLAVRLHALLAASLLVRTLS